VATAVVILPGPGDTADHPLFQQWSNAGYMHMIKALTDLQGDVVRYRAIQILLICACVMVASRLSVVCVESLPQAGLLLLLLPPRAFRPL
jgi:hypothetical protein